MCTAEQRHGCFLDPALARLHCVAHASSSDRQISLRFLNSQLLPHVLQFLNFSGSSVSGRNHAASFRIAGGNYWERCYLRRWRKRRCIAPKTALNAESICRSPPTPVCAMWGLEVLLVRTHVDAAGSHVRDQPVSVHGNEPPPGQGGHVGARTHLEARGTVDHGAPPPPARTHSPVIPPPHSENDILASTSLDNPQ
jgi:hypothetical protein